MEDHSDKFTISVPKAKSMFLRKDLRKIPLDQVFHVRHTHHYLKTSAKSI